MGSRVCSVRKGARPHQHHSRALMSTMVDTFSALSAVSSAVLFFRSAASGLKKVVPKMTLGARPGVCVAIHTPGLLTFRALHHATTGTFTRRLHNQHEEECLV